MKLRNILSASLIAMIMVSCSNEFEGVDNTTTGIEKNAILQFSITLPSAATRSGSSSSGGTTEGETYESNIKTINVRIQYKEGTPDDLYHFDLSKMGANQNKNQHTAIMKVAPSEDATIYVTVNGEQNVTIEGTATGDYGGYATLTSGIAEPDNFLMTGKTTGVKIEPNKTNKAEVTVERVAVKIADKTINKTDGSFTFETECRNLQGKTYQTTKETIRAEIADFVLCNLNTVTNIFAKTELPAPSYFQPFIATPNNGKVDYDYETNFIKKELGAAFVYCLENNSKEYPTCVIYRVLFHFGENEDANRNAFFIYTNEDGQSYLYKSFKDLDDDNSNIFSNGFNLNESSTYTEFNEAGVTKHENGYAYYIEPILTGQESKIVRNNIYELTVSKISGIGRAVIDPLKPVSPTLLKLTVTTKAWTRIENNFEVE